MKNPYSEIIIDNEILEASPHRLVQMMFEKCIDGISISKQLMRESDVPRKCQMITKVINIIIYLRSTLDVDREECKELSQNLKNVYDYIEHQLVMANLKNETIYLDRALSHIVKIKSAWDQIGDAV